MNSSGFECSVAKGVANSQVDFGVSVMAGAMLAYCAALTSWSAGNMFYVDFDVFTVGCFLLFCVFALVAVLGGRVRDKGLEGLREVKRDAARLRRASTYRRSR